MQDPHELSRFVQAQQEDYRRALAELQNGAKRSHWMWYIFPQYDGLGFSSMAKRYAIKSVEEAKEYLAHPILGPRLRECVDAILKVEGRTASQIFGFPDDMKLRSSLTLFAAVSEPRSIFEKALDKYYRGERDDKTLSLMGRPNGTG